MPVIFCTSTRGHPQTICIGLVRESRAEEKSFWWIVLVPGTPSRSHSLDHEEVIVGLTGQAVAQIGDDTYTFGSGDAIIVPAGAVFSLANPHPELFEALAVLPVGARASSGDGHWLMPPWTV